MASESPIRGCYVTIKLFREDNSFDQDSVFSGQKTFTEMKLEGQVDISQSALAIQTFNLAFAKMAGVE